MDLEPIAQTRAAFDELDPPDDELAADLRRCARRVSAVAPDCVGFSLAGLEHGVTFTLVASGSEAALLDAVQYLSSGPCVEAVEAEQPLARDREDFLSEDEWATFARATAAAGVASSLTLPIVVEGHVHGTVNLYGSSVDTFEGRHEAIAEVFSAWAPGAVTNADLGFATRRAAEEAPAELRARHRIATAVGIVAANERLSLDDAHAALREAALRAGVEVDELADAVIAVAHDRADRE